MIDIDMPEVSFSYIFLMFIIYAFVGWICEEIWCTVGSRKLVKRGMLHGPICPIYGFGALGILYLVYPWRNTFVRLFIASVIVTSILEYFTSWLLEKLFHAKWWDYSAKKCNLNGRVCLLNSVAFGIGGLALEHIMHPFVQHILDAPAVSAHIRTISMVTACVLSADILLTLHRLVNFTATMEKLKLLSEQLRERFENESWFRSESMYAMLASIREHAKVDTSRFNEKFLETIEQYSHKQHSVEFWLKRFPSMSSRDFSFQLEHLKTVLKESIAEQKKHHESKKSR